MSKQCVDSHVPGKKWEFNADVAKCFDDMLTRSIPGYEQMRDLVFRIGSQFVRNGHTVVDLGASRGEASSKFIETFTSCDFLLLEISKDMRAELHERFDHLNNVHIRNYDLRTKTGELESFLTTHHTPTLVLSILTLIFVPINYRPSIIQAVYNSLEVGGAFIVVEKVLGNSAATQEMLVDAYHQYKHDHGYSWEDIERKKAALEGVQVPISSSANIELLRSAGFDVVECFWRHLNFCGYIAIKR